MAAQTRTCQIDACSQHVPTGLLRLRMCLGHYLEQSFTRAASALEQCRREHALDSQTVEWLLEQGDLAVRLLANRGPIRTSEERARVLELLLCLANLQEYVRHHAISRT